MDEQPWIFICDRVGVRRVEIEVFPPHVSFALPRGVHQVVRAEVCSADAVVDLVGDEWRQPPVVHGLMLRVALPALSKEYASAAGVKVSVEQGRFDVQLTVRVAR